MKEIFVTSPTMPPLEEYIENIRAIWDTKILTNMGEKHQELENKLRSYLGTQGLSLMCNGHMALELALQAFKVSGEVITTPFTFASTTHAIVRNGLKPVFCDIKPDDYTIDEDKIEKLINKNTCAILPVHVYGNVCNVERIDEIAQKHGLIVIYDAAHAFGVKYKGKGIAQYGNASIFSFHATKIFNTIEGGAVCFDNKEIELELYRLKNFGIRNTEIVDAIGANAKMNEFQAAMGLCNLNHVESEIKKRKNISDRYRKLLLKAKGIKLNSLQKDVVSNFAYFPIQVNRHEYGMSRDELLAKLKENGIYVRKYFYPLTNTFECYKDQFNNMDTPIAMEISKKILALPIYGELEIKDVDRICNVILN